MRVAIDPPVRPAVDLGLENDLCHCVVGQFPREPWRRFAEAEDAVAEVLTLRSHGALTSSAGGS